MTYAGAAVWTYVDENQKDMVATGVGDEAEARVKPRPRPA
jgi:hypothetical protein